MAINDLKKYSYSPTNYVDGSEPDINAEHLNNTEKKMGETVYRINQIIDILRNLISTVQTNSDDTVPSSSLAYSMQRAITENANKIATVNSNLANVSSTATTANNKVQLNGPIKIIAYAGDGSWSFQQQYGDGHILSLSINDTQIAYDYYDGKNWTRKWTK